MDYLTGHQTAGRGRLGRTWLFAMARHVLLASVRRQALERTACQRLGFFERLAGRRDRRLERHGRADGRREQEVNGGCRSLTSDGREWGYIGEAAVQQKIISADFLGEKVRGPGVG